jgi:hypothetical protein
VSRKLVVTVTVVLIATAGSALLAVGDSGSPSTPQAAPTPQSAIRIAECKGCFRALRSASAKLVTLNAMVSEYPDAQIPVSEMTSGGPVWKVAVEGQPTDWTGVTGPAPLTSVIFVDRRSGLPFGQIFG